MRYLVNNIQEDLRHKMVFLGGPRQVGKTTLAKAVLGEAPERYLNWDYDEDRSRILDHKWPTGPGLVVLDEIHKYRKWRNTIKGLFDKRRSEIQILVTGSARLDLYRFGGDSLQGRYHYYCLHPLSIAELGITTRSDFDKLLQLSGFPEPFYGQDLTNKKRWSLEYGSRLIRDDLRDLERVTELGTIERLAQRLPELVGSPLSLNSLAEDLQASQPSVSRWCEILERLYYIFRIYPFGGPRIRATRKLAKHYHFDWSLPQDPGARLENAVACHLLKWCHFERDTKGRELELRYFRNIDGYEVDFVILEDSKPIQFIECKSSSRNVAKGLRYLKAKYPKVPAYQCVLDSGEHFINKDGVEFISLISFLSKLA